MASLSDQIDRFTRNTRAINAAASQTANAHTTASVFTRAVLYTLLGDLIRDIDPSELGLFTLTSPYDNDTDPKITRTQFQGATPLRKRPTRHDATQEIDPEVYVHAALKYIDQYEPIRPMPRAYDRILNILNRLKDVRQNIEGLSQSLKHAAVAGDVPIIKTRLESEERNIKELQERIAQLSKKKRNITKLQNPKSLRPKPHTSEPPHENRVHSLPSPKEERFFSDLGQTGRTLHFTDNLLHENMNLGDVGEASFDSPSSGLTHLAKSTIFAESDSFIEEPTITQFLPPQTEQDELDIVEEGQQIALLSLDHKLEIPPESSSPLISPAIAAKTVSSSNNNGENAPETPSTRHRRTKVNREVEKIVAKISSTMPDILPSPNGHSPPSVRESVSYIENLANQMPQLESPITSSASSVSIEPNSAPTVQHVLTAHLLTMLLSATPHHALPLNQVKENLALKAKTSGISMAGQGTTRILYGCVAKRLVKIDRSGREQIVKFDV